MDQRSVVPLEVGQQLAGVVFQAPDASRAAYRRPPRSGRAPRACVGIPANVHAKGATSYAPIRESPRRSGVRRPRQDRERPWRMFEAHCSVPPVQYDGGIRQRYTLQPPKPGVAVAQYRRRRVRCHAGLGAGSAGT
jgi:hypothetical protein